MSSTETRPVPNSWMHLLFRITSFWPIGKQQERLNRVVEAHPAAESSKPIAPIQYSLSHPSLDVGDFRLALMTFAALPPPVALVSLWAQPPRRAAGTVDFEPTLAMADGM